MGHVRPAAVAGSFYPSDPPLLRHTLERLLPAAATSPAIATLAPHAGYEYSGAVAGAVYSRVAIPRDVLLVHFNHGGTGAPAALWPDGCWETPHGDVAVAEELCAELRRIDGVEIDLSAFEGEHSGEVQVPMLRHYRRDVRIAPLSLQTRDPQRLKALAVAVEDLLKGRDVLVAATTDLTHCGARYGAPAPAGLTPAQFAREQDRRVLDCIASLDIPKFWDTIARHRVTMCGVAPTVFLMEYARARGATSATIVKYATSADDEPDSDIAVGYPGIIV